MFKNLPGTLRKLFPTLILIALAVLAGATDIFSHQVREVVSRLFQEYAQKLLPFSVNALIGFVVLNVAYLAYAPIKSVLIRAMESSGASERGRNLVLRGLQLLYWGGAIFIALTIVAPDVLSKVFLGGSLFLAALTLALQGAANDFICGGLLQFSPRFKLGDNIQLVGLDVKGKVKDIDYLTTEIESAEGPVRVPNREIWSRAVKVIKPEPPKSLIILPPGVSLEKEKTEEKPQG